MKTKERTNTVEKRGNAASAIKPSKTFVYCVVAFFALWTILIPTVCAANWLMERVTK